MKWKQWKERKEEVGHCPYSKAVIMCFIIRMSQSHSALLLFYFMQVWAYGTRHNSLTIKVAVTHTAQGVVAFWQQPSCLQVDIPRSLWLKQFQSAPDTPLPSMPRVRQDRTYWFHTSLNFPSNNVIVLPGSTGLCILWKQEHKALEGNRGHVTNEHINIYFGVVGSYRDEKHGRSETFDLLFN